MPIRPCPPPSATVSSGVLDRVGQSFLDDPIRGQVHTGRQTADGTLYREFDRQAGGANLVDEPLDFAQTGLRSHALIVGAQHLEHTAHLRQRGPTRHLHGLQRALCRVRILVGDPPRGRGLDDHDADVVGDDVMQLAGYAGTLLGHGLGRFLLPLMLQLGRPVLELSRICPSNTQVVAD